MEEIWKDIPEYEGLYQASNLGRIRSLDRIVTRRMNSKEFKSRIPGIVRSLSKNRKGYLTCPISKNDIRKHFLVHRLVALAFLPPCPDPSFQLNHINTIKHDNRVENLEWVSPSRNMRHAFENGCISKKGTKNGRAKLTESLVREIKKLLGEVRHENLADMYNISRCTINDIMKGRTWTHV